MFGLSFIIWIANSFMDSRIAKIQCLFVQVYFQENLYYCSKIRIFRSNRSISKRFSLKNYGSIPSGILKRANSGYGSNSMDISVGSSSDSSFEPQRR
jgi:hypothetical protein